MSKKITFVATINEIVEFSLTGKERIELIKFMLYDLATDKELERFGKEFLMDFNESKKEF